MKSMWRPRIRGMWTITIEKACLVTSLPIGSRYISHELFKTFVGRQRIFLHSIYDELLGQDWCLTEIDVSSLTLSLKIPLFSALISLIPPHMQLEKSMVQQLVHFVCLFVNCRNPSDYGNYVGRLCVSFCVSVCLPVCLCVFLHFSLIWISSFM